MKIVFLDIDGVLNSKAWFKRHPTPGKMALDPVCVDHIIQLCNLTNSRLVLTSSWRRGLQPKQLYTHLQSQGLRSTIEGICPVIYQGEGENILETDRGKEVMSWLSTTGRTKNIESFVIIDDKDDFGNLKNYLVQTNPEVGITSVNVDRAISILNDRSQRQMATAKLTPQEKALLIRAIWESLLAPKGTRDQLITLGKTIFAGTSLKEMDDKIYEQILPFLSTMADALAEKMMAREPPIPAAEPNKETPKGEKVPEPTIPGKDS